MRDESHPLPVVTCAIVGYGAIADYHAIALRAQGARLLAVAGPKAAETQAFAARHQIPRAHDDVERVFDMVDVDAIVIASPSPVHAMQATAALRAGKHVLCEIPIGVSLNEAETAQRAADGTGLVAMACHTQRYWPSTVALQRIIARDGLVIRHVIARCTIRRHENIGWTGRQRSWVDNLLWHHGGHTVDTAMLFLGGTVDSVLASGGPPFEATGQPMDLGIIVGTTSGAFATVALSYNSMINQTDYLVIADDTTYLLDQGRLVAADGSAVQGGSPDEMLRAGIAAQDRDFLNAITSGAAPSSSFASVLPTMRVLQQVADLTDGAQAGGSTTSFIAT